MDFIRCPRVLEFNILGAKFIETCDGLKWHEYALRKIDSAMETIPTFPSQSMASQMTKKSEM